MDPMSKTKMLVAVVGGALLGLLIIAVSWLAVVPQDGPQDIAEAPRGGLAADAHTFPYQAEADKLWTEGPSGQTRPTSPPIPGWMHSEMVFVAEVQKQSAYLREGYAPHELLTLGVVSCQTRNNDLVDVDMGQPDRQLIKNEAQKYLCVFYR